MPLRLVAVVADSAAEPKAIHYRGLPPREGEADRRTALPSGKVLLIEEQEDGIFLYRFQADGECVGDTWHMSVEDAQHQARYEFGGGVGGWREVPKETDDPVSYALATSADTGSRSGVLEESDP